MTHETLAQLLEQFAVVVLQTSQTALDADDQYAIIASGIDTIVESVMFCSDKTRSTIPSIN